MIFCVLCRATNIPAQIPSAPKQIETKNKSPSEIRRLFFRDLFLSSNIKIKAKIFIIAKMKIIGRKFDSIIIEIF